MHVCPPPPYQCQLQVQAVVAGHQLQEAKQVWLAGPVVAAVQVQYGESSVHDFHEAWCMQRRIFLMLDK